MRLHRTTLRALAMLLCMVAALALAEATKPRHRLAQDRPPIDLASQVPTEFGEWREDKSIQPLLPDPQLQARLDTLYTQVLARTYVNREGQRVMLSIAYGSDQGSEATAVHRPEFCYSAQGFVVKGAGVVAFDVGTQRALKVQRLVATQGQRVEPISYWVTLDDSATLPGFGRRLEQLRYGLRGDIPDGMLVRISTIGMPVNESFAAHEAFIRSLRATVEPGISRRYFGT